jgi:hypothetical protein
MCGLLVKPNFNQRRCMMKRYLLLVGMLIGIWATLTLFTQASTPDGIEQANPSGQRIESTLEGKLHVNPPVFLRTVVESRPIMVDGIRANDTVQLQISYESRPFFPTRVEAEAPNRGMTALYIVNTQNRVFLLGHRERAEGEPRAHFSVFLKANNTGEYDVPVIVTLSNGTQKTIPFKIRVS